jgi:hypothetical protein
MRQDFNHKAYAWAALLTAGTLLGSMTFGGGWWIYFLIALPIEAAVLFSFFTHATLDETGVTLRRFFPRQQKAVLPWASIREARVGYRSGISYFSDIRIFLKSGEVVKFSPIGVSIDVVEAINARIAGGTEG